MDDLRDLYQETILDHNRSPRNFGSLENPNRSAEGDNPICGDRLLYGLGEILIYGPLKDNLGMSRIRVAYTAGEALGPETFSFYRSLGINIKQVYGMTEATVFVTGQSDGDVRNDTVGRPLPAL